MTNKFIVLLIILNTFNILKAKHIIYPAPILQGDTIAICSPSGPVEAYKVEGAARVLEQQGWKVKVMPHALDTVGNYAGAPQHRYEDLVAALNDPTVRAVLCSRGGYGAVHILDDLDSIDLRKDPKWMIGFSDISALHALYTKHGIASIHSNMTGDIMNAGEEEPNTTLFRMFRGEKPELEYQSDSTLDRPGTATGRLVGGNVAVLAHLIGTPYNVFEPGTILFIEDIGEPIYKIERILYQLRLMGILENLGGLIVGQFTDYRPDRSHDKMEDMIADMVKDYQYPVSFNAPIGHVDYNMPVIENATVTLNVSPGKTLLQYH